MNTNYTDPENRNRVKLLPPEAANRGTEPQPEASEALLGDRNQKD